MLAIYGATDRFNYGDLLFPIVVNWMATSSTINVTVKNYAVADSDFSTQGALPTKALSCALNTGEIDSCNHFVVAGGQVLDARWTSIIGYLLGPNADLSMRAMRKLCGERLTDAMGRRKAGIPWGQPFVVPHDALPRHTTYSYNAVGGAEIEQLHPEYLHTLIKSLQAASYVSVRDQATYDALVRQGVESELAPDSAMVMSMAFPKSELKTRLRPAIRQYIDESRNTYLVFQIGKKFLRGREQQIARTIEGVARAQGLKILLLAIGTATAHEDDIALANIKKHLNRDVLVAEVFDGSVWEIMALIADAAIYIGTSLHGAITAMSFGVPHLAFTSEVRKLQEFLLTWGIPQKTSYLPITGNLQICAEVLSISGYQRKNLADKLVNMAENSLRRAVNLPNSNGIQNIQAPTPSKRETRFVPQP